MVASAMVRSTGADTSTTFSRLPETFGIAPAEHHEYVVQDPVLIVSHNFTYYAPEEIMAVPLGRPTIVTFGTKPAGDVQTQLPHTHLIFSQDVQDRVLNNGNRLSTKRVDVAEMHGAIIFRENMLFYKHLGEQPTVLAEKILGSRIIMRPGTVIPIRRGQTIGFGASSDAFGGRLWWYYFRMTSLRQLKQQTFQSRM